MKSLKSRLRRQDASGPAPSGATAPASAVSPAARGRPGLPALPSREPRSPSLFGFASQRPAGSASATPPPSSGQGSASARRPWGPCPPPPPGLDGSLSRPSSPGLPAPGLRDWIAPSSSIRFSGLSPTPALPRRPQPLPAPGLAPASHARSDPARFRGAQAGAPQSPELRAGRGLGALQSRWAGQWIWRRPARTPDLPWVSAAGLGGRRVLDAVAGSLGKFDF